VHQLAGVLFHMDSCYADALANAVNLDVQMAVLADGEFILADLVAFRQIRVEVVFAGKDRAGGDGAVGSQPRLDGVLNDFPVQHRQRAGQAEADRAGL